MWQTFSPKPQMDLPFCHHVKSILNLTAQGYHDPRGVLKFALYCAPFYMLNHSTFLARFSVKCMGRFIIGKIQVSGFLMPIGKLNTGIRVPDYY